MAAPIELHFYNKNNEIIKTYSQDIIKWSFFKKAVSLADREDVRPEDIDNIYRFVCDFYGNRFTVRQLKKYTDLEQLLAVAGQIVMRVLGMMKREGISFPNAQAAEKN